MSYAMVGIIVAIIAVVAFLIIRKIKKLAFKVVVIVVAVFLAGGGTAVVKPYIDESIERVTAAKEVISDLGEDRVKLQGTTLMVNINNKWYDVSNIKYSEINLNDVSVVINGDKVTVTDSKVVNAIKTLINLGFIES